MRSSLKISHTNISYLALISIIHIVAVEKSKYFKDRREKEKTTWRENLELKIL